MSKILYHFFIAFFCFTLSYMYGEDLFLRDHLKLANVGDFIVTSQNKAYTVLLVDDLNDKEIAIEEITAPATIRSAKFSWKNWIEQSAPGHTSWVRYVIDISSGRMKESFSYTKNSWYSIPEQNNFLSTLLNLKLRKVPITERKKVGPRPPRLASDDNRPYWQPKLIFEGQVIPGVTFDAWRTFWPKDGSELSGKIIEIFIPQNPGKYPAYFPYWLEVSGIVGKAKVHIVDSGRGVKGKNEHLSAE